MAESRNPAGYEKQKLYQSSNTPSQRVTTHAEMLKVAEYKTPMIFVVDNDEETGGEDVLYYWSGIEVRRFSSAVELVEIKEASIVAAERSESSRIASAAYQLQTGLDRTQTGLDVVATNASKDAATASAIEAAKNGVSGKTAVPSTVPDAGIEIYNISQAGTYVNFGAGLVVTLDEIKGIVQLRKESGIWTKFLVRYDTGAYQEVESIKEELGKLHPQLTSPLPYLRHKPSGETDTPVIAQSTIDKSVQVIHYSDESLNDTLVTFFNTGVNIGEFQKVKVQAKIDLRRSSQPCVGIGWGSVSSGISFVLRTSGVLVKCANLSATTLPTFTGFEYASGDTVGVSVVKHTTGYRVYVIKNGVTSTQFYEIPFADQPSTGQFLIATRGSVNFTSDIFTEKEPAIFKESLTRLDEVNHLADVTGAIESAVTINGVAATVNTSTGYTKSGTPDTLMIICHGNGQNQTTVRPGATFRNWIKANKISYATIQMQDQVSTPFTSNASGWGNEVCLRRVVDLYHYCMRHYNFHPEIILCGRSMGGLTMGHLAYTKPFPIKFLLGIGPVPSLNFIFNAGNASRKPPIRNAFGMAADGSQDAQLTNFTQGYDWFSKGTVDVAGTKWKDLGPHLYIFAGMDATFTSEFGGTDKYTELKDAINRTGGYCFYQEKSGVGHDDNSLFDDAITAGVFLKEMGIPMS
jgi:pimeloyl-ACP methyl ester carboxylesterase